MLLVVRPGAPSSFLLLLVRHLLLEAMHLFLVVFLFVAMPRHGPNRSPARKVRGFALRSSAKKQREGDAATKRTSVPPFRSNEARMLLGTSASLLVAGALLVVTRSY